MCFMLYLLITFLHPHVTWQTTIVTYSNAVT